MLIKFLKWFRGYLLVSMNGYSPERFINLCRNRNILIWNLSKADNGYEFYISLKAYRELRPIVRKTHTMPFIRRRIGFPFLMHRFRKRKAFLTGLFLFSAIIYIMSLFIWDISMEGQYEHTQEALLKYLNEIKVYPGRLKNEINCQEIEEAIRNEYKDIGWVSAEIKGTKLRLKLVETNMPVPYVTATEPCHIVASHDGIVSSIVTRKGTPMVKKGDEVKKGDILVSGIVDIIGDNDILLKKEPVISDADVIIRTKYSYKKTFPMKYAKRIQLDNQTKVYGMSIFDKNIFFFNPLKKFKSYSKYDIIVDERDFKLNDSFILPVSVFKRQYIECTEEECIYTKEEAQQKAQEMLDVYLDKLQQQNVLIIQNNVTIKINNKNCEASGYILVEEKAAEQKKITDNEWRMSETNELDGNDN